MRHTVTKMAKVLRLGHDMTASAMADIADLLNRGGVMVIPTDTFYGLAASPFHEKAIRRVRMLKGRPEDKPILILIADRSQLNPLVGDVTAAANVLMDWFWPGPLTLIMAASRTLSQVLTAGTQSIGIRQPGHAALRDLLSYVGPVTGTSANRSGDRPASTVEETQQMFETGVDLVLDDGSTHGGLPSTVITTTDTVRILREGAISRKDIQASLASIGMSLG